MLRIPSIALAAIFAGHMSAANPITFRAPHALSLNTISAQAAGDFRHTGRQDLMVMEFDLGMLLYPNEGKGVFGSPVNVLPLTSDFAPEMVAADFNHDGNLDVAVLIAGSGAGNITVLLGNGDGTFQSPVSYSTGQLAGAGAMIVGDFHHDGHLDIAVAGDAIEVFRGTGDGTFTGPLVTSVSPASVTGMAAADFNGDGLLDLAVCTNSGSTYDSSVYFYGGMGNGEFQPPILIAAGPTAVAARDLNGDGLPDLAGANPNNSGSIEVFLSNGNGTFQPPSSYPLDTDNDPLNNELSIAIADVNKDGKPDIVNGTYLYPGFLDGGLVTVLPGNGDGTFGAGITSLQGEEVSAMTLADFNGDGYPDVAFVGYNNAVSVALNSGTGRFESAAVYQVAPYARAVLAGRFQGTSRLDLALLDPPSLQLYPGAANGTFGQPLSTSALGGVAAMADFNGDGIPDVAVAGSNPDQVQVFFGQKDGNFLAGPLVRLTQHISSMAAADFNGDGIPDVAFSTLALGSNPGGIQVWLGDGTGSFKLTYSDSVLQSNLTQIVAADFNGDGKQDLAVTDLSSSTVFGLFLGNGNGTLQQLKRFGSGTAGTRRLTTGDFNGDGNLDVAASDAELGFIYVMLGNGSGGFQSAATLNGVLEAGSLATGDFNCDGHLDLAAGTGDQVSFFAGNGDGTFGVPVVFGAGSENYGLAIGDFNGDGKPDVATANFAGRSMSVLINTSRCQSN